MVLPVIWRIITDSSIAAFFCCPLFIFIRKDEEVVNTIQSEFSRLGVKKSSQEEKKQDQNNEAKRKCLQEKLRDYGYTTGDLCMTKWRN